MKIIIFAGGTGTRLWPLSRKNSPKQFGKFKDNKSTLQMAVERVSGFGLENIYISTNEKYVDLVKQDIPNFKPENIFSEPAKRDLAGAVGLTMLRLKRQGISGPVALLWSDHFMDDEVKFVEVLKSAEKLAQQNPERMIFTAEKPRFANHNLGWIHIGEEIQKGVYKFLQWKYRPDKESCRKMFESGEWFWNPGYFIFDIDFVLSLYKKFMPEMYNVLLEMIGSEEKIKNNYPKLEAVSFDNAIVEKIKPEQATVLKIDLGWSDPGTLYALKEALVASEEENFVKGNAIVHESKDCFIHNEEEGKLVAAVGLEGKLIVNTKDVLLVCDKDSVPEIKKILKKLEDKDLERYL